ncbi:substrate-binding domain-containing protein [Anaerotruncus colihominis]|uniref:substrate-binding domain-containing protein n=1 Tax=Anaerotruncus colihominis TaxID=169435 RepID=UPI0026F37417|nr:substrate-binding domain-containing protein [Anaerotruncus colihominis]
MSTTTVCGFAAATRRLLELGHRQIGCASGSIRLNVNACRYLGYRMALEEYGLTVNPDLLFCDSLSIACGEKALPCLLGLTVSALFAFNDMIAYGIYKECRNYNLLIPGDLSVIGVDDIFLSDIIYLPLTTVAQPVSEIAARAVNGMLHLLQGPQNRTDTAKLNPHSEGARQHCALLPGFCLKANVWQRKNSISFLPNHFHAASN